MFCVSFVKPTISGRKGKDLFPSLLEEFLHADVLPPAGGSLEAKLKQLSIDMRNVCKQHKLLLQSGTMFSSAIYLLPSTACAPESSS